MRKYGKWVLTLSLLASTPGLTIAANPKAKDASPSTGTRTSRVDNQRVAEDIANALRGRVKGEINIEYKEGVAYLSGSVGDSKMKERATSLVSQVANVSSVDNRLIVSSEKKSSGKTAGKSVGNEVVQAGHEGEKARRARVQQVNGEYEQLFQQPNQPANQADANSLGVPPVPSATSQNQEVAEQIGAALTEARLDGFDIQIRYQNGIALLDGSVGNQAQRAMASRVVSGVPGVRSVNNRLGCTDEQAGPRGPQGAPNQYAMAPQGYGDGHPMNSPYGPPRANVHNTGYMQPAPGIPGYQGGPPAGGAMPMGPGGAPPYPPAYGNPGAGASQAVYNSPSLPDHAWPTYAQYPNSAAVTYPQQYSASAWPYIGPFYPYPQVPLGWRDATLRWDDGQWNLMFKPRTDRWWWFLNPNNW